MSSKHNIARRFSVARSDVNIPPIDHAAYINYHDTIALEQYGEAEVLYSSKRLQDSAMPLDEKRELLFRLGHLGTIESFDLLCSYLKRPDPNLQTWAVLCLEECRNLLEMDLLGEEEGNMIMGPSGGIGERLRFYVAIGAADVKHWRKEEYLLVRTAFSQSCDQWNSQVEDASFSPTYVLLTLLIHIETAPDDLIMEAIRTVNKKRSILQGRYFITNIEMPDEAKIQQFLMEHIP